MRPMKLVAAAGALVTAALVGGTLISSVLAAPGSGPGGAAAVTELDDGAYCEIFLDTLAAELGVDRAALVPAGQAAATAAIDAAVEAGDIDADRAEHVKQRIAEYDGAGCGLLAHWRAGHEGAAHHPGRVIAGVHGLDAAAEVLGMETTDLLEALHEATLEDVAASQDVSYDSVKAAVLASVQTDLDQAVADERTTQEHADTLIERVTAWLDEGGNLPGRGRGHLGGDAAPNGGEVEPQASEAPAG